MSGDSSFLHHEPLHGLPECPQNMSASFPETQCPSWELYLFYILIMIDHCFCCILLSYPSRPVSIQAEGVCPCMLSHFSHIRLCNPTDCSLPGSSVHGIFQARILEWVAMPSSRGSSWPSDRTHVSYVSWIGRRVLLPLVPPGKPIKEFVDLILKPSHGQL